MKRKLLALLLPVLVTTAYAETVNFSGTVSTSCQFTGTTDGVLDATGVNGYYQLSTTNGNGRSASLDIAYQGSPTFILDSTSNVNYVGQGIEPTLTIFTGATFLNQQNQTNARSNGFHWFESGSKSMQLTDSASTDRVFVNLLATASSPFPVGAYSASTTVTCQ